MTDYERARDLVSKMTLKEKVGQLAQDFLGFNAYERNENNEIVLSKQFKEYVDRFGGIGMINNYFRADPWSKRCYSTGGITAAEREKAYNTLQKYLVEHTRMHIPALIEEDAPHGRQVLDSVLYPVSFNVGCSFNPELYSSQTEQIGTEARLGGVHVPYLSILDIAVDPRWGRSEECFSEDPYLSARMSEAAVTGMNRANSMVCCKHFAAQGAAAGGHNGGVCIIGERELREIHLPAAEAAVRAGCDFVMAAYNEIDGEPCHSNAKLLREILRDEFGFTGVVRSDGCAIDFMKGLGDGTYEYAAASALKAGVDCGLWDKAYTYLESAVEKGYVEEALVDEAVAHLLEKKYKCGVMDQPYLPENGQSMSYLQSGQGQDIALQMAEESLVLLENKNNTLPLQRNCKVLLVGENLNNIYYLLGDYTSEQKDGITVCDAFQAVHADYIEGWNFIEGITISENKLEKSIAAADVIIYGCGGSSVRDFESDYNGAGTVKKASNYMDCGEGLDLAKLELIPAQTDLLKKIKSYGKPVISLAIGGRAYVLSEIAKYSDALVWCGYPGQRGADAIFNAVYGKTNNFGKLSVSFPKHVGQLPINYNYKKTADYVDVDKKPLYPFGYGLSYSKFEYSDFTVTAATLDEIQNGKPILASITVENISEIIGKEVVQLYINRRGGTVTHRIKELCGFEKITLLPHEKKTIEFEIGFDQLKEWSTNHRYELCPMNVKIMVGKSSDDILYEDTVRI